MRSDLVFEAIYHVPNRYQLCQLVSKATRKMHRANSRVPDTANRVLSSVRSFNSGSGHAVQALKVRSSKDGPLRSSTVLSIVVNSPGASLGRDG